MNSKKFEKRLTLKKNTISNLSQDTMNHLKAGGDTMGATVCALSCISRCQYTCGPLSVCFCYNTMDC